MLARMWKEKAEQADEKASQKIFDSRCVLEVAIKQTCYLHMHIHLYVDIVIECRNKYNIVDLMAINLHGQHLKEGTTILKYHLAFGVYGCCMYLFLHTHTQTHTHIDTHTHIYIMKSGL